MAAFVNYTELPHVLPHRFWVVARWIAFLGTVALVGWLATGSRLALTVAWSVLVPLLPAVWLVAPGVWRNVCPMAFANQLPREFGFTRGKSRPTPLRLWAYAVSLLLLFGGITLRLVWFNGSALATALLLGGALLCAFVGGFVFKGKSGWCGTFCPLAPVQKLYGQLPLVVVRNEYCSPCLGCQTNCYDFNPTAALPSDLYDRDQWSAGHRRFFAGAYPGFVFGYFTFAQFGVFGLLGFPLLTLGAFETLRTFTHASSYLIVVLSGMTALSTYYAFAVPVLLRGLGTTFGLSAPLWLAPAVAAAIALVALTAFIRSIWHEWAWNRAHEEAAIAKVADGGEALRAHLSGADLPSVEERASGRRFTVQPNQVLLEAIETAGLKIETGCRMGMCGADPVLIVEGADQLAPAGSEERSTLQRLGLAGNCRMACSAHVTGPVTINIDSKTVVAEGCNDAPVVEIPVAPPTIRVVIIGNGAAGMSVAEHLRRRDSLAQITVVSDEEFHFYNRMGIGRLVYGRSAMTGLSLLEESWYEQQRIDVWLNTRVNAIDRDAKTIALATGERVPYDVLVLATGASAVQPQVPGTELDGSFVLRSAQDAMRLRHWTQTHQATSAVVIGGGVLGIEAADALHRLGIAPVLIARAERLMERQLDDEAGAILREFLEADGIAVRTSVEVSEILGDGRVIGVTLSDGAQLPCDLVLSCAGIAPNADLARAAGLEVQRGVVVDATMRTSDPAIFAVGDVAELPGALGGLWPVGKKQGEVAAATILGDAVAYVDTRTMMHVKLGAIDVKCYGDLALPSCEHLTGSTTAGQSWRRVAIKDGKIVGGVFVGESAIAKLVANALLDDVDVSGIIDRLRNDDWEALVPPPEPTLPAKIRTVSGGEVLVPRREPVK